MFIGGLPHTITEADLKRFFSEFGELEDYVVMVDRMTGKPRGFGFVTFAQQESVDRVMDKRDALKIKGKWIDCKRATPKEPSPQTEAKHKQAAQKAQEPKALEEEFNLE